MLLVEDSAVNQEVAVAMLKDLGCEVRLAENGREAVTAVSVRRIKEPSDASSNPALRAAANSASVHPNKAASRGASNPCRTLKSGCAAAWANLFQGQTSWQSSQP